mmetsp:Transcript_35727/g.53258  ORF Transcript_35727/g.53258 Transcript_35727/m.53258 type:complete len:468 (-) Transcript_35727:177-1580(-)|eukprot:CAMPEP_0194026822 /NCGR_PEP_ID=MMETSP0009_2-20130614/1083_1 /TAXON_ID=210454 /ORGANISM="Grammatophora oceanica, Strain CCMP 410" /LENGTH=467 /DNA_ID=CAMNT_0038665687 /DNA_START=248 /DNA_END=1651 /DNA_ORIENTATION=+
MDGTKEDLPEQPKLSQVTSTEAVQPTKPTISKRKAVLITIAGVAGNVLEWYDFAVFGFFSDVIASVFFPPQQDNYALIESFVVFGIAFWMRPVGGILLGYVGDKFGRKRALEYSIFLMAIPTFLMGCLPGYEQIGPLAIVLLAIVRLLQGLSVGGQLMSSLVFTVEGKPKEKWGLYGSYVMASANFGTLLGGVVAFILRETLTEDQLIRFGWRIPFLCGILVSVSGVYLKCAVAEDHGVPDGGEAPNPVRNTFARGNWRSLLASCLVPMIWSSGFYLSFVWMSIFMAELIDPPVNHAFAVNSASLFLSVCLLFPLAGILSDKVGRVPIMTVGGIMMACAAPIMIVLIGQGNAWLAFFAQSVMGVSLSLWGSPMMAWLVEAFPTEIRLTSVATGYNIAQATVGGLTPAFATFLVNSVGNRAPGLILTVSSLLSLLGLLIVAPRAPLEKEQNSRSQDHEPIARDDVEMT